MTLLAVSLVVVSTVFATLPSPNLSAKEFMALVQTAAANFGDNDTASTADAFRRALAEAQAKGQFVGLPAAAKLSPHQLKNAGKLFRLAAVCELQFFKGPIMIRSETRATNTLSDAQLQKMADDCAAKGEILRKESPIGSKATVVPASQ